jgi:hypothetical protein
LAQCRYCPSIREEHYAPALTARAMATDTEERDADEDLAWSTHGFGHRLAAQGDVKGTWVRREPTGAHRHALQERNGIDRAASAADDR